MIELKTLAQRVPIACLVAALCSMSAACSSSVETSLVVFTETGLAPGSEFDEVLTEVFLPEGDRLRSVRAQRVYATRLRAQWATGVGTAQFEGLPPGEYVLRVTAYTSDATVLVRNETLVFLDDVATSYVRLDRACVSRECPNEGGSAALTACLGGACVDPRCDPEDAVTRDEYCPGLAFCSDAAECGSTSDCAEFVCQRQLCIESPIQDFCTPGERCDPLPDVGCTTEANPLTESVCNTVRRPRDMPCESRVLSCEDDTREWVFLGFIPAGEDCVFVPGTCDGAGACVEE